MRQLDDSILRAYDIRGIVGETLYEDDAYAIGRAFATMVAQRKHCLNPIICVGYDGRLTSPSLAKRLQEGLVDSGAVVYAIGLGPTPMVGVGVKVLQAHAGMMVTGSHNPPSHNGIKMMLHDGPFYGEDIQALGNMCRTALFAEGHGRIEIKNIYTQYLQTLHEVLRGGASLLTVAWDAGNGATGDMLSQLVQQLPGKHHVLNGQVDGTFPVHHPDPSVAENLEQLIDTVKTMGCDLGIAFDGDGDRIGVVDHLGRIIEGDHLVAMLAKDVLDHHPGATIIVDIKTSQPVLDYIQGEGGHPILWKSGHSFIKAKMIETKAQLAGEVSGHIFFADHFGFDDGLYAGVRLLSLLQRTGQSLAQLYDALPKAMSTPEIRIDVKESQKFGIIDAIKARLVQEQASFIDIDGVRVQTKQGWWLLRASNTQAVLVMRCEAANNHDLHVLVTQCKGYLKAEGVSTDNISG